MYPPAAQLCLQGIENLDWSRTWVQWVSENTVPLLPSAEVNILFSYSQTHPYGPIYIYIHTIYTHTGVIMCNIHIHIYCIILCNTISYYIHLILEVTEGVYNLMGQDSIQKLDPWKSWLPSRSSRQGTHSQVPNCFSSRFPATIAEISRDYLEDPPHSPSG